MTFIARFALCAIAVIVLYVPALASEHPIVIGTPCFSEKCSIQELENILSEAYSRIGRPVEFRYMPPKRVILEAEQHLIDALGLITPSKAEMFPSLRLVRTPIAKSSLSAFTMKNTREVRNWKDLNGMTVGIIRGSILVGKDRIESLSINPHFFNEVPAAFAMLEAGRLDCLLGDHTAGSLQAKGMGIEVKSSPPLMTTTLHHAVNENYVAIVPQLEAALQRMLRDGTTEMLLGKFLPMLPDMPENRH